MGKAAADRPFGMFYDCQGRAGVWRLGMRITLANGNTLGQRQVKRWSKEESRGGPSKLPADAADYSSKAYERMVAVRSGTPLGKAEHEAEINIDALVAELRGRASQ